MVWESAAAPSPATVLVSNTDSDDCEDVDIVTVSLYVPLFSVDDFCDFCDGDVVFAASDVARDDTSTINVHNSCDVLTFVSPFITSSHLLQGLTSVLSYYLRYAHICHAVVYPIITKYLQM